MSLRTRLFVLFGGLIAVFALAQGWLVRALSRDLDGAVDDVAFRVSSSVVGLLLPGNEQPEQGVFTSFMLPADPQVLAWHSSDAHAPSGTDPLRIVLVGEDEPAGARRVTLTSKRFRVGEPVDLKMPDVPARGSAPLQASYFVDLELAGSNDLPPADVVKRRTPGNGEWASFASGTPSDAPSIERARYVPIPREKMLGALESFHSRLYLGSLALLVVAVLAAGWVAHRVSVPMRALARASVEVGSGALGKQVDERADGEVETAIRAFNQMSQRLASLDGEARALREREHLGEIGELARGLAHSLRNPLHGLGLSVDELAASANEDRARAMADVARTQIRRIDRALRSFLALSAAGAGDCEAVSLEDLARDVALEAMQDVRSRAHVELDVGDDLPRIRGVHAELRAILQALVVNAVEASREGSPVRVLVAGTSSGGVRIDVEDRGAGIPPQIRSRLFTPHVTTKEQGSGLGLYLSRRIATTRYGGTLWLEDREGGGTRAVLELFDRTGGGGRGGLAIA